jgi:hypothetical protein
VPFKKGRYISLFYVPRGAKVWSQAMMLKNTLKLRDPLSYSIHLRYLRKWKSTRPSYCDGARQCLGRRLRLNHDLRYGDCVKKLSCHDA